MVICTWQELGFFSATLPGSQRSGNLNEERVARTGQGDVIGRQVLPAGRPANHLLDSRPDLHMDLPQPWRIRGDCS